SGRTLWRAAAARRARPRADRRTRNAAARRAALEPRREFARGDAFRDPPPARRIPLHYRLCDARSVRGDDDRGPDCRDEFGENRATWLTGRDLRPAALGVRGALHRVEQYFEG